MPEDELTGEARRPRHRASSTCAQARPDARREDRASSGSRASARSSSRAAPIRRARSRRRCSAAVGTDNYGLTGLEQSLEETLHGTDGQRKIVKDATGQAGQHRRRRARRGGRGPPADDRRRDPGAHRGGPVRARPGSTSREGATALVMDPRNGEVLAMANWPRVDANDIGDAPEYARQNRAVGLTLRARLDLQGVHRRGRARGAADHARARSSTCRPTIQVADRTIRESHAARRRDAHRGRHPRPVVERRHGHDRAAAGHGALRLVGAPLRLRLADRHRPARRGAGHRAAAATSTRAPRSGTCRSARASPSRRSRWPTATRRSRTAA